MASAGARTRTVRRASGAGWLLVRVLSAAAPATGFAYVLGVNGGSTSVLGDVLGVIGLIALFVGPVILGWDDGMRAVLAAAALSVLALAIATWLVNHHSGWQPCLVNYGSSDATDGLGPSPCRGDMSPDLGVGTALWITILGGTAAAAGWMSNAARKRRTD